MARKLETELMSKQRVAAFYRRLAKANPNPKGELDYVNDYTLLVAIVLSAQATDKSVNKASAFLFKKVKTPKAMVKLGEQGLIKYIQSIGLFRMKARNIIKLSERLIYEHQGKVPSDRQSLEALAGVGRKTANVFLNIAHDAPVIAVDTHIFRVANRTGLAYGKDVLEVERSLLERTPKRFLRLAHHWLILHGRYICQARKMLCGACVVSDLCNFPYKTY